MNLYYIHLGLDYYDYIESNNNLRYEFQKHTNFLNDYFSKSIRKYKHKTDGTYNMISVSPTEYKIKPTSMHGFGDVIDVSIEFNRHHYESVKGTLDCGYYLELLEEGFKKANEFKDIPLDNLLNIMEEFKKAGCKNEWVHKKKRFKEFDLEIILTCEFTTNYFQVISIINKISTKKELVKGVIIRTEAGVSIHEGFYKDILIEDDKIIINDKTNCPRIIINKSKVLKGILDFKIRGNKDIKKMLSYQL